MARRFAALAALVAVAWMNGAPANADSGLDANHSIFPRSISLPAGFQPEGIAIGPGAQAYFGSRVDGSIFRVSLVSGEGAIFSQGPGTGSYGMKIDALQRLFVAGGPAGNARIIDLRTGVILQSYQLATERRYRIW